MCIIDAIVTEALSLGQLKVYFNGDRPSALAVWAYLNEAVEARLLSGGAGLRANELKVGDRLWVADVIAPLGGSDSVRAELAVSLFKTAVYRELRVADRQRAKDRGPLSVTTVNPSLTYRPARREDVAELAPRLRQQDIAEIKAATGRDAERALIESFDNAKRSALVDGQVYAMFGIGHVSGRPNAGRVWMLGSEEVFRQRRALLRDGPIWL